MSELERQIGKVLEANGSDDYDPGREETFRQMLADSFKGRTRWMVIYAWAWGIAVTGVMVFAAIRFFTTESEWEWIFHATLFLLAAVMLALIKLWYWMLINRNSITREIKRLELRIAALADRLGAGEPAA
jgi:hypothetical protein